MCVPAIDVEKARLPSLSLILGEGESIWNGSLACARLIVFLLELLNGACAMPHVVGAAKSPRQDEEKLLLRRRCGEQSLDGPARPAPEVRVVGGVVSTMWQMRKCAGTWNTVVCAFVLATGYRQASAGSSSEGRARWCPDPSLLQWPSRRQSMHMSCL